MMFRSVHGFAIGSFLVLFGLATTTAGAASIRIAQADSGEETLVERPAPPAAMARRGNGDPAFTVRGVTLSRDASRAPTLLAESVSASGDVPTAGDNDYTRINEAIQAIALVGDGTVVRLVGTFDWTEPNAFASWQAAGFELVAPAGVANVKIRAAALGDAVILGPFELATESFESFLFMFGGTYQGWTIENLDIRGFDWSIGMFFDPGLGSSDDFDGVTIANNRIEMPADLNANAAPADNFQNVALHLGFGSDQRIIDNEIIIPGDGVSDTGGMTPASAASVALQSNTSGGTAYDGLRISGNSIRITGAQNADPERIYGIWENAHGHQSDILVDVNVFVNEAPGNDPAVNFQRAFRITSHSSATTTVSYENNRVEGANIGLHWIGDGFTSEPPPTVLPILVTANTLLGNGTAVFVHSDNGNTNSKADLSGNRIAGNTTGVRADDSEVNAENNWWGCNDGPGAIGCDGALFSGVGFLDADPFLVLGVTIDPPVVEIGDTAQVTATLRINSDAVDLGPIGFPETDIALVADGGTIEPFAPTSRGEAIATFTATDSGLGSVTAGLDNAVAADRVLVTDGGAVVVQSIAETGDTPSGPDNDYTRINDVVQAVGDSVSVRLDGTFDWTEPFAALAWSRGTDGVGGNGDDFALVAPAGFTGVSLGAASLGEAVIQGPGDLPGVNLETFLGLWQGAYQGWTIENLDIRGFDLALGMFFTTTNDFDGVTVRGNRIELPPDLNANAAPDDINQNIAIHLSFGDHQTITGNEIVIPGTGASDTGGMSPASAASVALQSNTSGASSVYEGLEISDNLIRITGAQNADPERIYGIWENSHDHRANIAVTGNRFLNEAPANDPSLNFQRAFRITAHSSDTSTVRYAGNTVQGANIGLHWIGDSFTSTPPAFVLPVEVTANTLVGNGTAIFVHSDGGNTNSKATVRFNRLVGNTVGLRVDDSEVTAEDNWWGSNGGPGAPGADTATFSGIGFLDTDPWLVLGARLEFAAVCPTCNSAVTADLRRNSDGVDLVAEGTLPDATPVAFAAAGGTISPPVAGTLVGLASALYTAAGTPGLFGIDVTVDAETVSLSVDVSTGVIFNDGFESGDTSQWSSVVP